MLAVFSCIFVEDTKIIYIYNLIAVSKVRVRNLVVSDLHSKNQVPQLDTGS